ncbi:uracil-DNA glycosylase [Candidatus Woesearchaeota archaeon]|nr:uracil-DNA glycosylase [Candidatus Woesearchaeota archaeon]
MDFEALKQEYLQCKNCPKLMKSRSQVVFGSGNPNSKILFIGEAPGANEDKQGIPFCGMSGQILTQLLNQVGLSREDIFITNTILCRPEKNRNPDKNEVENCRKRLDHLISIMQPEIIVTIGNFATDRIINKTGVTSIHGQVFKYNNISVVPVIHPANYLYSGRNPVLFNQMLEDFKVIFTLINKKS